MAAAEVCTSLPRESNEVKMEINEDSYNKKPNDDMEVEDSCLPDGRALALSKKEEGNKAYSNKNYKIARELYTEAIDLDPGCAAYYGNRAAASIMLMEFQGALDDSRKAYTLNPSFVKAYLRAGKCYIATGQTNNALQVLEKAKLLDLKNKLILEEIRNVKLMIGYEMQSGTAYEKGDYRQIEFCMRRLLEFAPTCANYRGLQAECLALNGKYGDAQLIANDILQKDRNNKEALYVRGLCLYYQDQVDRAYTLFQHLLRTAPDFKKAKEVYRKAKNLETTKEAGNQAFRSKNYDEAVELYTKALLIDPVNKRTNSKLYCNRATVNAKLGKHNDAINDCAKAIELDPSYLKAYLRRAKCYMDTEKYEEAVRDYEKISKMDHSQEYRRLLKEAKLELKKSKRKDYYKILGVSKNSSECDIKKAYRKEALKHHPDRHSNAEEETQKAEEIKFKEVGEAYSVLSDKEKRYRYDNGLDLETGGMDLGEFDPNLIFQSFFGGAGGGCGRRGGGGFPGGGGGFPGGFSFSFG